jgi:hypothetical protein
MTASLLNNLVHKPYEVMSLLNNLGHNPYGH